MYEKGQQEEAPTTEYAQNLKQSLEDAYVLVRTKLSLHHERRKAKTRKHMATLTKKETWSGYILLQWAVESPRNCIMCGRDRSKCLNIYPIVLTILRGSAGTNQYRLCNLIG